jgi:hypothetical protein
MPNPAGDTMEKFRRCREGIHSTGTGQATQDFHNLIMISPLWGIEDDPLKVYAVKPFLGGPGQQIRRKIFFHVLCAAVLKLKVLTPWTLQACIAAIA